MRLHQIKRLILHFLFEVEQFFVIEKSE